MGRKKIDTNCKLPEAKINSTFTKRKRGAVNKAKQLGKLCDVDVALIAFHPRNDAVIAVSHGGRVDEIINKFHDFKQQHLEKVQFCEELRTQSHQVQAHQMHTNTQVPPHLPLPTFEMGLEMPMDQLQGFDMQAQGNNGNINGQQQLPHSQLHGFGIQALGNNNSVNGQQQLPQGQIQGFGIQALGNNNSVNGQQQLPQGQIQGFGIQALGNNNSVNGQQQLLQGQIQGFGIQAQGYNSSINSQQQLSQGQLLLPTLPPPDF